MRLNPCEVSIEIEPQKWKPGGRFEMNIGLGNLETWNLGGGGY